MGFSTNRCLLVAAVSSASLFLPRLLPAKIAAVALSAVAMRADAEDGFARVATSWTKQNLIELLQPKDLSSKYGLSGSTQFHRLSGHNAKGFVSGFGSKNDLRGRLKFLATIAPADYVDELKILAAANASRLDKMKTDLAYLCKSERQERQFTLEIDGLFHLDGGASPYTSLADTPDLCVMDTLELIYVSSNKAAGKFHHSSFFSGKPVKFAGEMRLKQRTVKYINNVSGHYKPSTQDLFHALTVLQKKYSCDLTKIRVDDGGLLGQIQFFTNISCLSPTYIRGEAYLAAGQGNQAAAEFQKILDHSGIVWNCWAGALAHLGVARANALQAKSPRGAD